MRDSLTVVSAAIAAAPSVLVRTAIRYVSLSFECEALLQRRFNSSHAGIEFIWGKSGIRVKPSSLTSLELFFEDILPCCMCLA